MFGRREDRRATCVDLPQWAYCSRRPGQRCTAFDPVQTLERSASRLRLREGPTFGLGEGARFIGSIVGACVVLAIYGFIAGRTSSRSL